MGNISIIARRLEGGHHVQYGWSGNGGYYSVVGARLLKWYNNPDKVEYLFGLGQMKAIGKPGSEYGGAALFFTNVLTNEPHWLGKSEREIFSKIMFVDYGYFYDTDLRWYYVIPGPFRVKIPLEYIGEHLDEQKYEFDECERIKRMVIDYILGAYYKSDAEFRGVEASEYGMGINQIRDSILSQEYPMEYFSEKYEKLFSYFDDWVVVKISEDLNDITGFLLHVRQRTERRETIEWQE